MAREQKRQNQALRQAFLELAQEDVQSLRNALEEDAALRQQADALYQINRLLMTQRIGQRLRQRRRPAIRYTALAAGLLLLFLGIARLTRPPKDTVALSQPAGGMSESPATGQASGWPATLTPWPTATSPVPGLVREIPTMEPAAGQTPAPWTAAPASPSPTLLPETTEGMTPAPSVPPALSPSPDPSLPPDGS